MRKRESFNCPSCGGPLNHYQAVVVRNRVYLLCECWSGDLNKGSKYHIYLLPFGRISHIKRKLSAYNLFVGKALKDGKGMPEAAKLWKAHKNES